MDRELLIEIGVEELPAAWMPKLTSQLADRLSARLSEFRIAPGAPVESFSTPRRLTVRVAHIAERQEDLDETITGPPVSAAFGTDGQPTPAALGFAKKQSVSFEQLTRARTPKGEYLAFQKHERSPSRCIGTPGWTTDVASSSSGVRFAGCCSCMVVVSSRTRLAERPAPLDLWSRTSNPVR